MVKLFFFLLFACYLTPLAKLNYAVGIEISPSVQTGLKNSEFSLDTADNYCPHCYGYKGWLALRIPLQNALEYKNTPAMASINLSAHWDSAFSIYSELPLQRDLEAWQASKAGHNIPLGFNEININVPYTSYARWQYASQTAHGGAVQIGRFAVDLGPSPYTLVLGTAPAFHEALHWQQSLRKLRFDFVLVSLDAQLLGTPREVGIMPPEDSEAWQQMHLTVPNQRHRIYAQPAKNLLVHKLSYHGSWGHIAAIEQSMVGGKPLDFRDFTPFMLWHNNFSDGYTKSSTTLELALRPSKGHLFYWQLNAEDIASPVGETSGETFPNIFGILAGWQAQWLPNLRTSIDAIYTDPAFNNYRLPLLKMTSRQVYRSNYRHQDSAAFADTYIMDYPLGYLRGPDALDLWFNLQYQPHAQWNFSLDLAWLRQGQSELWDNFDSAATRSVLSGVVEEEKRAVIGAQFTQGDLSLQALLGYRALRNENHRQQSTQHQLITQLNATWRWGIKSEKN